MSQTNVLTNLALAGTRYPVVLVEHKRSGHQHSPENLATAAARGLPACEHPRQRQSRHQTIIFSAAGIAESGDSKSRQPDYGRAAIYLKIKLRRR